MFGMSTAPERNLERGCMVLTGAADRGDVAASQHLQRKSDHQLTHEAARRMPITIGFAGPHLSRLAAIDVHGRTASAPPLLCGCNVAMAPSARCNLASVLAGSRLKVFPFLAPTAFQESAGLTLNAEHVVMAGGLLSPLEALPSSSRVLSSDACAKSTTAQLTIFYDGQVYVYNVSSAKAQEIILMAAAGGSLPEYTECPGEKSAPAALPPHINEESQERLHIDLNTWEPDQLGENHVVADPEPASSMQEDQADSFVPGSNSNLLEEEPEEPDVPRALPQARKASLARFLERRKERLRLRYPVEKSFI